MTLGSLIGEIQGRQHQVTVYRSGNRLEIETWLAGHGVNAESRSLPSPGPNPFIEIKTDGEVIGIIGVEAIEALLEPPIYRPGDQNGISEGYRVLFDILERMVFSAMSRRETSQLAAKLKIVPFVSEKEPCGLVFRPSRHSSPRWMCIGHSVTKQTSRSIFTVLHKAA